MNNDSGKFRVAIVGSGPAGLSAAGRAAELGMSHVLLEATGVISNTVNFWYQKGKHVMDEPTNMPLRSSVRFTEGTREEVLEAWEQDIQRLKINIRFNAALKSIEGEAGAYKLTLMSGDVVEAESVVLAIGNMGNIRKLGIPGEDHPIVGYKLDDASALQNKRITVVGAGDSALEDALALAKQNQVTLINRRNGFDRAKGRNAAAIQRAIANKEITCIFEAAPEAVIESQSGAPADIKIEASTGSLTVPTDMIIIRAGAMPQRKLLDSMSLEFPSADETAFPIIGEGYQASRQGIYVIGALAGCPLIKEAMNQGYEVIEHIDGRPIDPADQELVESVLKSLPGFQAVRESLNDLKERAIILKDVTDLVLREFVRESKIRFVPQGTLMFSPGDYSSNISLIVSGKVASSLSGRIVDTRHYWGVGELLGLVTLRSGLPWGVYAFAGEDTVLLETPVKTAGKLFNSVTTIKHAVERVFLERLIFRTFIGIIPREEIREDIRETDFENLLDQGELLRFKANQPIYAEGDPTDAFYIILKGSVSLSRLQDGKDKIQHLVTAGNWFGIDEIYLGGNRLDTATASTATEIFKLNSRLFHETISRFPSIQHGAERKARKMLLKEQQRSNEESTNAVIGFVEDTGVVDGSNVLVIDEALCVRCDNCEKACAETHGGVSRLRRKAGDTFATIHVPTACRHCYEPGCMKDCPANCISRQPGGQVLIDTNTCIGCGNCSANCPFGVIQMVAPEPQQPLDLWSWLFWGKGRPPGQETEHVHGPGTVVKKAMKCDLCHGQSSGPACVQACPTGAAIRSSPDTLVTIFEESKLK